MAKPKEELVTPPSGDRVNRVGMLPVTVQEAMSNFFDENPCVGNGDLRAEITLEALQRTEQADYWIVERKRLSRADVMELMLHMVSSGYSIPAILRIHGMPTARTFMAWLSDYKVFAQLMESAEQLRGMVLAEQALEIVDGSEDEKQGFRDRVRADVRMRMAEVLNPKKYGKKQIVDVTHHDDLSSPEVWSRFKSILLSYRAMIEENTGIKIVAPILDAEIVATPEEIVEPAQTPMTLGMQGATPEDGINWEED